MLTPMKRALRHYGENEIGVLLGKKREALLRAYVSPSPSTHRSNGDLRWITW